MSFWSKKGLSYCYTTGSPSSYEGVNMTSCNGIKKKKLTNLSCCVCDVCFYGIWRGFGAISVYFGFSVFLSICREECREECREAKTH